MDDGSILCGESRGIPDVTFIHRYFEKSVEDDPKANINGIYYSDRFVSYLELNKKANAVARVLQHRLKKTQSLSGKTGQSIIAIDVEPSENLILALLATLKLGAAYLPIDSRSAINRVRHILNESQPVAILADSKSAFGTEPSTLWSEFLVINIDDVMQETVSENASQANLAKGEMLHDPHLVSILYTSGSTGKPKGVRISHETAANTLSWQWQSLPFHPNEVGAFKTSLLFVDSMVEIFGCALQLVPLLVLPKGCSSNPGLLVTLLEQHHVSRITLVPSLLWNILAYVSTRETCSASKLPDLWLWISSGETLPPDLLKKFFSTFQTGKTLANVYGSTETMAFITCEMFSSVEEAGHKSHDGHLSIGKPVFNNNIYLVDESQKVVPVGEIGEICVSGLNLADGYLGKPERSGFVYQPYTKDTKQHGRIYRTGDYGLLHEDRIIFIGRKDNQVKIRGHRINMVEIERSIQECPSVDKVVTTCYKLGEISSSIIAYYTTHHRKWDTETERRILDHCQKSLPAYMQPKLLHLEEIPLLPHTGKVDGLALRKIYRESVKTQHLQKLAAINDRAEKALHIIGLNLNLPITNTLREASFFELGGNSISMVAAMAQLLENGFHLSIDDFVGASRIQDIVDHAINNPGTTTADIYQTGSYVFKSLRDVTDSGILVEMISESFAEKSPTEVLLGITKEQFLPFAKSVHREALKEDLSFAVLEKTTNQIVGGAFLFNFLETQDFEPVEILEPTQDLLNSLEHPFKEMLRENNPGRFLYNLIICVDQKLSDAEQVNICTLIEDVVLRLARKKGFEGVVTTNTHPVTQVGLYSIPFFGKKVA